MFEELCQSLAKNAADLFGAGMGQFANVKLTRETHGPQGMALRAMFFVDDRLHVRAVVIGNVAIGAGELQGLACLGIENLARVEVMLVIEFQSAAVDFIVLQDREFGMATIATAKVSNDGMKCGRCFVIGQIAVALDARTVGQIGQTMAGAVFLMATGAGGFMELPQSVLCGLVTFLASCVGDGMMGIAERHHPLGRFPGVDVASAAIVSKHRVSCGHRRGLEGRVSPGGVKRTNDREGDYEKRPIPRRFPGARGKRAAVVVERILLGNRLGRLMFGVRHCRAKSRFASEKNYRQPVGHEKANSS